MHSCYYFVRSSHIYFRIMLDNLRCNLLAVILPITSLRQDCKIFPIELWLYYTGVAASLNEMQSTAVIKRCVCVCYYYPNNMQVQTATFQTNGLRCVHLYVHSTWTVKYKLDTLIITCTPASDRPMLHSQKCMRIIVYMYTVRKWRRYLVNINFQIHQLSCPEYGEAVRLRST